MSIVSTKGHILDPLFGIKSGSFVERGDMVYSCTLNQTDLETNKNKFYIMQLVNVNNVPTICIRYGRVSEPGKVSTTPMFSEDYGIDFFEKQFRSKTGNKWGGVFVKKPKKYFMAEIVYEEAAKKVSSVKVSDAKSTLHDRVQYLIGLLSNIESMNNSLVELDINPKKMPLGKISNSQIDNAKKLLKEISVLMESTAVDEQQIKQLSSSFYTFIPYACGRRKPPTIDNKDILGSHHTLLEELEKLAVAIKLVNDSTSNNNVHPLDSVYNGLLTKITPLKKDSYMWEQISSYVVNTHARTHNYKTELVDVYEIERTNEKQIYDEYTKNIGNKTLLWHGSRVPNFCSILQKGLILNPETLGVVITGKMFGNAIYFSDTFSKSFNYCAPEISNNYGAILLCEVALGNQSKKVMHDYHITKNSLATYGYDSVHGAGQHTPSNVINVDGINIPNGVLVPSKIPSSLLYNEYTIYDTRQMCIKYMIIVKKVA